LSYYFVIIYVHEPEPAKDLNLCKDMKINKKDKMG